VEVAILGEWVGGWMEEFVLRCWTVDTNGKGGQGAAVSVLIGGFRAG
jgi:hypothetical protein